MLARLWCCLLLAWLVGGGLIERIPQLSPQNYREVLMQYEYSIVEYFNPGCYHCRKYAKSIGKVFGVLEEHFLKPDFKVRMYQFNCAETNTCYIDGIRALPTVRIYRGMEVVSEKKGKVSSEELLKFVLANIVIPQEIFDTLNRVALQDDDITVSLNDLLGDDKQQPHKLWESMGGTLPSDQEMEW